MSNEGQLRILLRRLRSAGSVAIKTNVCRYGWNPKSRVSLSSFAGEIAALLANIINLLQHLLELRDHRGRGFEHLLDQLHDLFARGGNNFQIRFRSIGQELLIFESL
jgi:hypothetical protein